MRVTILHDAWRPHPLAWIHRAEAREIAAELRRAGHTVELVRYSGMAPLRNDGALLLRLSDAEMLAAARLLGSAGIPFLGPRAVVMERCYDKYRASRIAQERGIDCPVTSLGDDRDGMPFPCVIKPRLGSDSIGVRVLRRGPVPARARNPNWIVQEHVRGLELTAAVMHGRAGTPLQILVPEGAPYTFARKYLVRPRSVALADTALAERVRSVALEVARIFEAGWATRVDLIAETATGRLRFLECDVAPLVGPRSAFAASFTAAGVGRGEQLRMLLDGAPGC